MKEFGEGLNETEEEVLKYIVDLDQYYVSVSNIAHHFSWSYSKAKNILHNMQRFPFMEVWLIGVSEQERYRFRYDIWKKMESGEYYEGKSRSEVGCQVQRRR